MMSRLITIFLVAHITSTSLAAVSRTRRQAATSPLCSQANGRFPVDGNCRQFIQCDDGVPGIIMCSERLVFNPNSGECDRASNVPSCQNQGNPSDPLCSSNPGRPGESWKVAHPNFCNAFYTCEQTYVHRRCEFCGEGTYFSQQNGFCVGIKANAPLPAECSQKQLVPHRQKAILEVYPDCVLFRENPFRTLVARLEGQAGIVANRDTVAVPVPGPVPGPAPGPVPLSRDFNYYFWK